MSAIRPGSINSELMREIELSVLGLCYLAVCHWLKMDVQPGKRGGGEDPVQPPRGYHSI